MTNEVKQWIGYKVNVFEEHFTVPEEVQGEVDAVINELNALGESCATAEEFEEKFNSTGLVDKYNGLFMKLKPKAHKMTAEEKQYSKKVFKDIVAQNKGEIVQDFVKDVALHAKVEAEGEFFKQNRERMMEEGTWDDYTMARHKVSEIGFAGKIAKKLFKKK